MKLAKNIKTSTKFFFQKLSEVEEKSSDSAKL
jgi:hypothetical protein